MANLQELADKAYRIRRLALRMGQVQGQGYIGQALGVADADRAGGSEPQRNHERKRRHIESDLMCGARDRIEHARHRRREREHADFGAHLRRGRQPKREQPPDARGIEGPIDVPQAFTVDARFA